MRSIYFGTATSNMRLYRQLKEVFKKFTKEDIPIILLKGAHLAKYIYGDIALRPMADIDRLIKQDDLGKAHRLLIKDGYSNSEMFEEELPPYEKKWKIPLDLHSHLKILPNKEYVNITALWMRAEKVNLGEAEALILSPEDLVLHLCLHNCIHHCLENSFISCFDIAHTSMFYKGKLDWNQLWARG